MGYNDKRGNITIHAMYRYDGANKGAYMTFNIQNSVYLPLYLWRGDL